MDAGVLCMVPVGGPPCPTMPQNLDVFYEKWSTKCTSQVQPELSSWYNYRAWPSAVTRITSEVRSVRIFLVVPIVKVHALHSTSTFDIEEPLAQH
jgi:hypothetical protein